MAGFWVQKKHTFGQFPSWPPLTLSSSSHESEDPGFHVAVTNRIEVTKGSNEGIMLAMRRRKKELRGQWNPLSTHLWRKRSPCSTGYRITPLHYNSSPERESRLSLGIRKVAGWNETGIWWELLIVLENTYLVVVKELKKSVILLFRNSLLFILLGIKTWVRLCHSYSIWRQKFRMKVNLF
jgi:hypothetical protein